MNESKSGFDPTSNHFTKKEELDINKAMQDGVHEYDPFCDPHFIASKHGLDVVLPQPNQLFIDIDTEEQYKIFCDRICRFTTCIDSCAEWYDAWIHRKETPSNSGLPHRHITLTFKNMVFTNIERLAYQAALGDDPVRIYLNGLRIAAGFEPPITFFEKRVININDETI